MSSSISAPKPKAEVNMYEGQISGRQLSETVEAFLHRLPPQTTSIMDNGPWIYISNPYSTHVRQDWPAFMDRGHELLEDYEAVVQGIEASMAGKAKATITRQLTPLRKQLELDIFTAAKEKGCVSGKWMLFPSPSQVNHCWELVAKGTAAGELGHAAKVATDDGSANARLICIYTEDFGDKGDVKRVLERLLAMGLVNRNGAMGEGRAIYYKADAYTYLDIMSKNEWGLKPSLYSSREVLAQGE
ncbi:hypothetical protein P7C71_g6500, partial [Lecanoromycetidae sp. Uapishka_2]